MGKQQYPVLTLSLLQSTGAGAGEPGTHGLLLWPSNWASGQGPFLKSQFWVDVWIWLVILEICSLGSRSKGPQPVGEVGCFLLETLSPGGPNIPQSCSRSVPPEALDPALVCFKAM
jgi:hypothetical protein